MWSRAITDVGPVVACGGLRAPGAGHKKSRQASLMLLATDWLSFLKTLSAREMDNLTHVGVRRVGGPTDEPPTS